MKNIKLKIAGLLLLLLSFNGISGQNMTENKNIEHIALKGNSVFPEGIITLPNNDILVGGFGDGSIQRIGKDNKVSFFSEPGQNGMLIAVGFHLDPKNKRLWVANFNLKPKVEIPAVSSKCLITPPENY